MGHPFSSAVQWLFSSVQQDAQASPVFVLRHLWLLLVHFYHVWYHNLSKGDNKATHGRYSKVKDSVKHASLEEEKAKVQVRLEPNECRSPDDFMGSVTTLRACRIQHQSVRKGGLARTCSLV